MFQAVVQRAQRAVDSTLTKLMTRAAVAVPLVVAAGFGTAALTVTLTEVYGSALSYTMMGGLFAVLGGITAAVVSANGTTQAQPKEAPSVAEDVAEVAAPLLDRETLVALLTTAGPVALPGLLRLAARNLPLLVMAVIVAIFFFGRSVTSGEGETAEAAPAPQAPAP
ncbi:MAG: hypothetical protein ACKVP3_08600 [Hyphomicrobiaceae bacterium]